MSDELRQKPDQAELFGWFDFEIQADLEGYGEETEDWMAWWCCWKEGYKSAEKFHELDRKVIEKMKGRLRCLERLSYHHFQPSSNGLCSVCSQQKSDRLHLASILEEPA